MAAHTVCVKTEHLENRRVTISFIWAQMVCQDAFFNYTVLAMFIWNQYLDTIGHDGACGAETGIFWTNKVNTMAVDALAPCVTRSSATIIHGTCIDYAA